MKEWQCTECERTDSRAWPLVGHVRRWHGLHSQLGCCPWCKTLVNSDSKPLDIHVLDSIYGEHLAVCPKYKLALIRGAWHA